MKKKSILLIFTTITVTFWIFLSVGDVFHYLPLSLLLFLYILVLTMDKDIKTMTGALLLFYAMFLTPAYFEPSDLILSTGWLATASLLNIPLFIIIVWMLSGYITLVVALYLFGKSIHSYLNKLNMKEGNKVIL